MRDHETTSNSKLGRASGLLPPLVPFCITMHRLTGRQHHRNDCRRLALPSSYSNFIPQSTQIRTRRQSNRSRRPSTLAARRLPTAAPLVSFLANLASRCGHSDAMSKVHLNLTVPLDYCLAKPLAYGNKLTICFLAGCPPKSKTTGSDDYDTRSAASSTRWRPASVARPADRPRFRPSGAVRRPGQRAAGWHTCCPKSQSA